MHACSKDSLLIACSTQPPPKLHLWQFHLSYHSKAAAAMDLFHFIRKVQNYDTRVFFIPSLRAHLFASLALLIACHDNDYTLSCVAVALIMGGGGGEIVCYIKCVPGHDFLF